MRWSRKNALTSPSPSRGRGGKFDSISVSASLAGKGGVDWIPNPLLLKGASRLDWHSPLPP
jgi:hypothetical protein